MFSRKTSAIIVAVILLGQSLRTDAMITSVFTTGLSQPAKIAQTPLGRFLVTETLGSPNSGRISIIDRDGDQRTLIDGLPSGTGPEGSSGPSGIEMWGRSLFVAIGEGDGASSPNFSSVLQIHFPERVENATNGFTLSMADQAVLANHGLVLLDNGGGDWISIKKLADFPNTAPDSRRSNPFALTLDGTYAYVADGGMNLVWRVRIGSGQFLPFATFPPRPNPLPFGPPFVDAVPAGIRFVNDQLLVALFTGFPFAPGLSEVMRVDTRTGNATPFIRKLSSAIDVLGEKAIRVPPPPKGENTEGIVISRERYYVLEFSTDFLANEQGRLSRFQVSPFPFGQLSRSVVADDLTSPSGMVRDAATGDIFITEIFTGRIVRVRL